MQVKKYEASTVIEALKQIKDELGPEAIILSTQESKKSLSGAKSYVVVAAVTDVQMKKKNLAEKQMGQSFAKQVVGQPALKQKMFIENVVRGVEKRHEAKNRRITATPYIQIDDEQGTVAAQPRATASADSVAAAPAVKTSPVERVKQAAQEAFKTSLSSEFFESKKPKPVTKKASVIHPLNQEKPAMSMPLARMVQSLQNCGVSSAIVNQLVKTVKSQLSPADLERKALVDSWFAKWILNQTHVTGETSEKVEFFVGPHGTGKTLSLVKAATNAVINENKKVAIVTTDLNRVGAVEQLRVYSRILNAPVFVAKDIDQLEAQIAHLENYDRVFVDTPGISLSNIAELDFIQGLRKIQSAGGCRVHLVISALTKESDLPSLLKTFRVSGFDDIIITNIDQTSQHGILINIQQKIDKAIHAFGIGSDVVDGFELASKERVLDLVFQLTKRSGERRNDSRI